MNETIVSMDSISKSFPGVKALDHVHFELRSGEVMALLGENGAGKSTLMKILSGVYTRDEGSMAIFGKEYGDLSPKQAQEVGVAIIHQELNMCRHLSVAENMFLGREKKKGIMLSNSEMEAEAQRILDELKIDLRPQQVVGDLPVSMQQMVEIAKALSTNARILIMDEPTSALTAREIEDLFRIIRDLKSKGCGIVYISHRLEELQHIVDRVTIMRDGQYITSMNFKDATMDEIIANMVGREIKEKFPRVECEKGKLVLDGKEVSINKPEDAIKAGIVLAPEDRKKDGLCTKLSIRHNIALPNLDLLCNKLGVVSSQKEHEMCDRVVENLKVKTPTVEVEAGNLSGGNQQKVVVGKWLARNSRVVIFDEPTRGIDVAAKVEIYNLMNELKQQGIAVMFVSSEMPEVMGIADRIIVMCDGRITGELAAEEATQNQILTLATQFEKKIASGE